MDEMHIKCPHCGNEMDVELHGKKSSLVICVCGRCGAPLMSTLDGESFELDRDEFQTLRKKLLKIGDALRNHARSFEEALPETVREEPPAEEKSREKITQEDIDNLKIDLETCKSVSEFLERL